jgi:hypothetical protein
MLGSGSSSRTARYRDREVKDYRYARLILSAPSHPDVSCPLARTIAGAILSASLVTSACTAGHKAMVGAAGSPPARSSVSAVMDLTIRRAGFTLAAPIQRAVAVDRRGDVIIAGGLAASGTTVGGVFALDPSNGRLRSLGSLGLPVHDATGAMIGSSLFVFGGGSTSGSDLVQSFDLKTNKSAVAGHLPVALSDLGSASVGGRTYLIGGYDGRNPRREIYATTDGSRFRRVATLPAGLRYPAVASMGSTIFIAGGTTTRGPSADVLSFDTTNGRVRSVARLPKPVAHAAAFTLDGAVFVAGGTNGAGDPVSTVTRIDPSTGNMRAERPLPVPLSDMTVALWPDEVLLIGGAGGSGAVDDVIVASERPVGSGSSSAAAQTPASNAASRRPFAGLLLVADRGNNRLLVINSRKRVVWTYPAPNLPAPPHTLYFPDDAFWVHGGHAILVNEEENDTAIEIAYPSGKVLWTYGHPKVPGSGPGYLHQPDDLYPYPGGGVVVADAKNCRILFLDRRGRPTHQIGSDGVCNHGLPATVGYPNGDTPLPSGDLLISELIGHWVDEVKPNGRVVWAHQVPGVIEPSDPQRVGSGKYMVASYASPGAIVVFDRRGRVLWTYHPARGVGMLDHPSLAVSLPNGLIAVNDDRNHRVVLIDRKTKRIVWQYGETGVSGSRKGLLSFPDGLDLLLPGGVIPLHVDFSSTAVRKGVP